MIDNQRASPTPRPSLIAAIVALQNLGTSLNTMFSTVSGELDKAVVAAGGASTP